MVHVPGPAEIVLPLEDRDVVDAQAFECDGRAHPTESRADDQDVVGRSLVSRSVVCRLHGKSPDNCYRQLP